MEYSMNELLSQLNVEELYRKCIEEHKPKRSKDPIEIFLSKIKRGEPHECWRWQGCLSAGGYGQFRGLRAHRFAWELWYGRKIPEGYYACHHCDNPRCCNPEHIFIGTASDNLLDSKLKRRKVHIRYRGIFDSRNLSDEDKNMIYIMLKSGKCSPKELARVYRINQRIITEVIEERDNQ